MENIVIVGSGPAGLTAGIYAARAGFAPLVIEGMLSGGQLTETAEVENFPGFAESVSGLDLMMSMRKQAEKAGVRFAMDAITSVDFSATPHKLEGMSKQYEAKCVIIATGATPRWTQLPGEDTYKYRGISSCAVCDGNFHQGKDVAVIGGGDTALADAIHLAKICATVTLIHRRDTFRGTKVLVDRVLATPNIKTLMNTEVLSFEGDEKKLNALKLSNGEVLSVSGAFVAIGHDPQTPFLKGALDLDESGYVRTDGVKTSVAGVFAAGDCANPLYKQAVVAASTGAQAAQAAQEYLSESGS
ncbi:MAG: thioredoxin-disulfide reductase [Kiritimatiellae bacterium]|nr:thioredoxin-disulfide reductase [Kiritimatiellia bacterium]